MSSSQANETLPLSLPAMPQPAVVIGLGRVGAALCAELEERQRLYTIFRSPLSRAYDCYTQLIPLEHGAPPDGDAATLRRDLLSEGRMRSIAYRIQDAYSKVRYSDQLLGVEHVNPTICVVGAMWEAAGAAMLWPLAEIIRARLGANALFRLFGVFVAANYTSDIDERERGDARTFAVLREGNHLRAQDARPPDDDVEWEAAELLGWQHEVRRVFPLAGGRSGALYDHVFLLDSLKANNTTFRCDDDDRALTSQLAILLEALMFSALPEQVEQTLLDDYHKAGEQIYIGFGAASLGVPLRAIDDSVAQYTLGTLLNERLLTVPQALADPEGDTTALAHAAGSALARQIHAALSEAFLSPNIAEVDRPDGTLLRIGLSSGLTGDGEQVEIFGVTVVGADPFSRRQHRALAQVSAHLAEEAASCQPIVTAARRWLQERMRPAIAEAETICEPQIAGLLRTGDHGLIQAQALVERTIQRLGQRAAALQPSIDASKQQAEEQGQRLLGSKAWYLGPAVLGPAVDARARTLGIMIRMAMLGAVLFRIYLESALVGQPLAPLGWFAGLQPDSFLSWVLIIIPTIVVLLGAAGALAAAIPEPVSPEVIATQRRAIGLGLQLALQHEVLSAQQAALSGLIAQLRQRHLEPLSASHARLKLLADQALARPLAGEANGRFGEYAVIDPASAVEQNRQRAASRVLHLQGQQLVECWKDSRPGAAAALRAPGDVVAELLGQVRSAVDDVMAQPVEAQIAAEHYEEWFDRLWLTSLPWIKVNSTRPGNDILELNTLLTYDAARSSFGVLVRSRADYCRALDWNDPFRIVLLRMQCGIQPRQLARYPELRQAMEEQTAEVQRAICAERSLLRNLRARPAPPPAPPRPAPPASTADAQEDDTAGLVRPTITDQEPGDTKGQYTGPGREVEPSGALPSPEREPPDPFAEPEPPVVEAAAPARVAAGRPAAPRSTAGAWSDVEQAGLPASPPPAAGAWSDVEQAGLPASPPPAAGAWSDVEQAGLPAGPPPAAGAWSDVEQVVRPPERVITDAILGNIDQEAFPPQADSAIAGVAPISPAPSEAAPAPTDAPPGTAPSAQPDPGQATPAPAGGPPNQANVLDALLSEEPEMEAIEPGAQAVAAPLEEQPALADDAPQAAALATDLPETPAVEEPPRPEEAPQGEPAAPPEPAQDGVPATGEPDQDLARLNTSFDIAIELFSDREVLEQAVIALEQGIARLEARLLQSSGLPALRSCVASLRALVAALPGAEIAPHDLVETLGLFDILIDQVDATTLDYLRPGQRLVDRLLDRMGIDPVRPLPGDRYDPATHGALVTSGEPQADLRVRAVYRRGYCERASGRLIVPPLIDIG